MSVALAEAKASMVEVKAFFDIDHNFQDLKGNDEADIIMEEPIVEPSDKEL